MTSSGSLDQGPISLTIFPSQKIQIRWKFHLALIHLLMIISRQNLAHAMTAQLSGHVPNMVAITLLIFG